MGSINETHFLNTNSSPTFLQSSSCEWLLFTQPCIPAQTERHRVYRERGIESTERESVWEADLIANPQTASETEDVLFAFLTYINVLQSCISNLPRHCQVIWTLDTYRQIYIQTECTYRQSVQTAVSYKSIWCLSSREHFEKWMWLEWRTLLLGRMMTSPWSIVSISFSHVL